MLLSTKDVAIVLGTNVNYVIGLIVTQRLSAIQIGRKYKVPDDELESFINGNMNKKLPSYSQLEKEMYIIKQQERK